MPTVTSQYATASIRGQIERALRELGKAPDSLTASDLAPLEHFYTLGQRAARALAELAGITAKDRVLNAGGGIGGTARFLADHIGCNVISIDLTGEYCDVARLLDAAVGLDHLIEVLPGRCAGSTVCRR